MNKRETVTRGLSSWCAENKKRQRSATASMWCCGKGPVKTLECMTSPVFSLIFTTDQSHGLGSLPLLLATTVWQLTTACRLMVFRLCCCPSTKRVFQDVPVERG